MKPDKKICSAANQFLTSVSILEVLPTVQQKADFADKAIKTILDLNHCGFCLKEYTPAFPIHDTCQGCSVKDDERIDKSFDCPLQKSANYQLIPLQTTESFWVYGLFPGGAIVGLSPLGHLLLMFGLQKNLMLQCYSICNGCHN